MHLVGFCSSSLEPHFYFICYRSRLQYQACLSDRSMLNNSTKMLGLPSFNPHVENKKKAHGDLAAGNKHSPQGFSISIFILIPVWDNTPISPSNLQQSRIRPKVGTNHSVEHSGACSFCFFSQLAPFGAQTTGNHSGGNKQTPPSNPNGRVSLVQYTDEASSPQSLHSLPRPSQSPHK